MEELFFNDVVGNVHIDSLIPSIIGLETDAIDQIEELVEKSSEGYVEQASSEPENVSDSKFLVAKPL